MSLVAQHFPGLPGDGRHDGFNILAMRAEAEG